MYTILGPFVFTEDSCSLITFSLSALQPLSQKVCIKDQFLGVKDPYNNLWSILWKLFIYAFIIAGAVI